MKLKKEVYKANMLLPKYGLITFTWGNVSQINRKKGLVAIKPSGVEYAKLKEEDIVVVDLEGKVVQGKLNPSSDLATHLEIYKAFGDVGGITHTHSLWATAFAQACEGVTALGTTHADYFYGEVPCTRKLSIEEINTDYELNTGNVIVECFSDKKPLEIGGVLVASHGPFTWGKDANQSVEKAVVLEQVAKMAYIAKSLKNNNLEPMQKELLDKHYLRKHGDGAYYGQGF